MTKTKMYRYLGRNGIITSPVLLNSVEPIEMFLLRAGDDKVLTNGVKYVKAITVFADELEDWVEVNDPNL